MAWSSSIYSFLTTTVVSSGTVFTFDVVINESTPGILFKGTEANAVQTVIREVAGDLWIVSNADWNGANWIPINLSLPVYGTVFRSPSNVSTPGQEQRLTAAAGVNPVVWKSAGYQSGTGSVIDDSSASATITFATAFSAAPRVIVTVNDGVSFSGNASAVRPFNITATGFSVMGFAGTGVSVNFSWLAIGN